MDQPTFQLGRLGGIVDVPQDIVEGSNHHMLWLHSGMAVMDAEGPGVGLCSIDAPLVSLEEPGVWRYSRRFVPTKPYVYINLFNNQWSTNFRFWNGGSWSARVRLWAIQKYDAENGLITPSWEARCPLLASMVQGPAGSLPSMQTGLQLSRKGVLVTAFGSNPEGEGTILRLWEQAGQNGPSVVTLPEGIHVQRVQPIDLRGRPVGKPLLVHQRRFQSPLTAFAPASFLIHDSDTRIGEAFDHQGFVGVR
jgi:hypothetical protein